MLVAQVLASSLADAARARAAGEAWAESDGFGAFHAATVRPLWAFLRASCGNPALAEDLAQESWLRLLGAGLGDIPDAERRAYLYRIAVNLLRDHWRSRRRAPEPLALADGDGAGEAGAAAVPGAGLDVRRALGRLGPRERQLLWLAHVEGLSHREVARILGLGAASVRVLLFRARRRLAAELGTPVPAGEARPREASR